MIVILLVRDRWVPGALFSLSPAGRWVEKGAVNHLMRLLGSMGLHARWQAALQTVQRSLAARAMGQPAPIAARVPVHRRAEFICMLRRPVRRR